MLQTLHIRDLALIDHAEIEFGAGLNVISGATGGGKSLVVSALGLLRGGRATAELVRHGAAALRVDGEFVLGAGVRSRRVADLLAELGAEVPADGALLVTRIVDRAGRSKVRIGGAPATLGALRELGGMLLEIHGQGDARALMRPEIQCETLDAFAGLHGLRAEFAAALAAARSLRDRLADAAAGERDRLERIEFLRYQLQEMEAVGLAEGELERLEAEHAVLGNLDALRERLGTALEALVEGDAAASDSVGQAARALAEAGAFDAGLAELADRLADVELQVADVGRAVQSRLGDLDLDPGRLAEVEDRLGVVHRALARFGPTAAEFTAGLRRMRAELDESADSALEPAELERRLRAARGELARLGKRLTRARQKAAVAFAAAIEAELGALGMGETAFRVGIDAAAGAADPLEAATAHGPGPVDFLVRINPGEPERSMRQTASGGEMARIVLAVKKCLADQDRVPFVAFDEIDAEIGGRLGVQVGRKLREVAAHHQVLIVTHLPQVAAFADAHFRVVKRVRSGRTLSSVERLQAEAAERELAAMAGNEGADGAAIEEARRLVRRARGPG